jgi:integrase
MFLSCLSLQLVQWAGTVTLHTRLQRRKENGIYYCRVAVPERIRHIIGKREIHISLRTSDVTIARERVKAESYRIDQLLLKASGRNPEAIASKPITSLFYATQPHGSESITFAELVERFFRLPEKAKMTERSKLGYRVTFRILTELVGANTPINQINRADCRRVQEVFTILPANSTKLFPGLTVLQIVDKAQKMKLEPMNPVSANTYIMRLSSMLGWAVREGLITNNPAQGLLLPEAESAKDKRQPFTPTELIAIFNAEKMLQHRCSNSAAFWIPMLSLWTGARLNELCQLHTADIQTRDGIPCILIASGDGKRLKTANSERIIPIHPQLAELGFLKYVQQMQEMAEVQLFPNLKLGSKGSTSDGFSKDFARFLKSIGIKTNKNCFHSFRHNFRDALREAGIEREVVQALGGWKDKSGGVEDNYGSGHRVARLFDAICKVSYELGLI